MKQLNLASWVMGSALNKELSDVITTVNIEIAKCDKTYGYVPTWPGYGIKPGTKYARETIKKILQNYVEIEKKKKLFATSCVKSVAYKQRTSAQMAGTSGA